MITIFKISLFLFRIQFYSKLNNSEVYYFPQFWNLSVQSEIEELFEGRGKNRYTEGLDKPQGENSVHYRMQIRKGI